MAINIYHKYPELEEKADLISCCLEKLFEADHVYHLVRVPLSGVIFEVDFRQDFQRLNARVEIDVGFFQQKKEKDVLIEIIHKIFEEIEKKLVKPKYHDTLFKKK